MELTAQVFYACAGLALVLVVILLVLPAPRRPFGLPPALALALAGLAAAVALGVGIAMPGWLLQESKATDDRLPVYAGVVGYQFAMKPDERGWSTLAFDLNGGGKTRSGDSPAVPELLLPGVASEGQGTRVRVVCPGGDGSEACQVSFLWRRGAVANHHVEVFSAERKTRMPSALVGAWFLGRGQRLKVSLAGDQSSVVPTVQLEAPTDGDELTLRLMAEDRVTTRCATRMKMEPNRPFALVETLHMVTDADDCAMSLLPGDLERDLRNREQTWWREGPTGEAVFAATSYFEARYGGWLLPALRAPGLTPDAAALSAAGEPAAVVPPVVALGTTGTGESSPECSVAKTPDPRYAVLNCKISRSKGFDLVVAAREFFDRRSRVEERDSTREACLSRWDYPDCRRMIPSIKRYRYHVRFAPGGVQVLADRRSPDLRRLLIGAHKPNDARRRDGAKQPASTLPRVATLVVGEGRYGREQLSGELERDESTRVLDTPFRVRGVHNYFWRLTFETTRADRCEKAYADREDRPSRALCLTLENYAGDGRTTPPARITARGEVAPIFLWDYDRGPASTINYATRWGAAAAVLVFLAVLGMSLRRSGPRFHVADVLMVLLLLLVAAWGSLKGMAAHTAAALFPFDFEGVEELYSSAPLVALFPASVYLATRFTWPAAAPTTVDHRRSWTPVYLFGLAFILAGLVAKALFMSYAERILGVAWITATPVIVAATLFLTHRVVRVAHDRKALGWIAFGLNVSIMLAWAAGTRHDLGGLIMGSVWMVVLLFSVCEWQLSRWLFQLTLLVLFVGAAAAYQIRKPDIDGLGRSPEPTETCAQRPTTTPASECGQLDGRGPPKGLAGAPLYLLEDVGLLTQGPTEDDKAVTAEVVPHLRGEVRQLDWYYDGGRLSRCDAAQRVPLRVGQEVSYFRHILSNLHLLSETPEAYSFSPRVFGRQWTFLYDDYIGATLIAPQVGWRPLSVVLGASGLVLLLLLWVGFRSVPSPLAQDFVETSFANMLILGGGLMLLGGQLIALGATAEAVPNIAQAAPLLSIRSGGASLLDLVNLSLLAFGLARITRHVRAGGRA